MQQSTCTRYVLAFFLVCAFSTLQAQYGDFGLTEQPADTASVDDIIFYGDYMDMSGGYNVGDTVFNFTAYDFEGQPINLYDQLNGNRPVVLVSGSVSCIRFRNVFDPTIPGQEVWAARTFIYDHQDDFNWIFIYGVEAHPTDGNCPSNCPPTINTDTAVVQPSFYAERRWAMHNWENSPEHDFPFTMYADNPDNAIYNNFFQRPFGLIALNCDGTVGIRADWVTSFFMDVNNEEELLMFRQNYTTCEIDWEPEEEAGDDDTTEDDDTTDDDEPIDYDGPDSALGSHSDNEVASTVSEFGSAGVLVYPNPARSSLTTETQALNTAWQLTDMQGRTVVSWMQSQFRSSVSVADLPRGHYLLIGESEDAPAVRQRIILH